jgi:hypothetical protein
MDEGSHDDLRKELASLEAMEARISAERRRLHEQIDFGYASEATRAREREVSDERRELHRRIDALRELLGVDAGAMPAPESGASLLSQWTGIAPEAVGGDDASVGELEL